MVKRITVYISDSCLPCKDVENLIANGQFLVDKDPEAEVKVVNIATKEGLEESAKKGISFVPVAYNGKNQCSISVQEIDQTRVLVMECTEAEGESEEDGEEIDLAEIGEVSDNINM